MLYSITEQLQVDHLDWYEAVKAEIHQLGQIDGSSPVSTTYLGKTEIPIEDALKAQEQCSSTD